jgi:hypothetical protein
MEVTMGRIQLVGLDAHKDTIDASVVGSDSAVPEIEKRITNSPAVVKHLVNDLKRRSPVVAAYEADCVGFELQRKLCDMGVEYGHRAWQNSAATCGSHEDRSAGRTNDWTAVAPGRGGAHPHSHTRRGSH